MKRKKYVKLETDIDCGNQYQFNWASHNHKDSISGDGSCQLDDLEWFYDSDIHGDGWGDASGDANGNSTESGYHQEWPCGSFIIDDEVNDDEE